MDLIHKSCSRLDVHKDTAVACSRLLLDHPADAEVRTFATTTRELLALGDWLAERRWTHAGMGTTGVYWKTIGHELEGSFELLLANAQHERNGPRLRLKSG
jgi:hypothetical protein